MDSTAHTESRYQAQALYPKITKQLRLRVEKEELPLVLDYIVSKGMCGVTNDHVEEAVNSLLGEDRFIEPGE